MKVTIETSPNEKATLVLETQERPHAANTVIVRPKYGQEYLEIDIELFNRCKVKEPYRAERFENGKQKTPLYRRFILIAQNNEKALEQLIADKDLTHEDIELILRTIQLNTAQHEGESIMDKNLTGKEKNHEEMQNERSANG